jgi:hypothetical protein
MCAQFSNREKEFGQFGDAEAEFSARCMLYLVASYGMLIRLVFWIRSVFPE